MNGYSFGVERRLHGSKVGSVMQREVFADTGPYHQHVFPFQLTVVEETGYVNVGDWHDTFPGHFTMRFSPSRFTGKMVVHCHSLKQGDQGAMGIEAVAGVNGSCFCGETGMAYLNFIVLASVTSFLYFCYCCVGYAGASLADTRVVSEKDQDPAQVEV